MKTRFKKIGVPTANNVAPKTPELRGSNMPRQDFARNKLATEVATLVGNNPNVPVSPITCSGTSFQCRISGSGKTKIVDQTMYPQKYDHLGSPIREGGMLGKHYQPNVILNWQNNISTQYTKESLKNTYGFENFQ